jgi:hypothetical protein
MERIIRSTSIPASTSPASEVAQDAIHAAGEQDAPLAPDEIRAAEQDVIQPHAAPFVSVPDATRPLAQVLAGLPHEFPEPD